MSVLIAAKSYVDVKVRSDDDGKKKKKSAIKQIEN